MTSSNQLELAIDIETYSAADIKHGVYRYAEDPSFEVLLIAYKFSDQDDVELIDLTENNTLQGHARFREALVSPEVIKTAYNANFERTCLARWFGEPMPPEQWRCTMILALSCGLPASLKDAGSALELPADETKDKKGKALIQYFCKPCRPTKSNGQRTRNLPAHDRERWYLFGEYCKQDVVTEQAILERLRPWRPNKAEQDLWTLDQNINDRGVGIDVQMAHNIVEHNETYVADLKQRARDLTGLDNPNSLSQLLPWLASRGVETPTLRKNDVVELLAKDIPDDVREVLTIRQEVSKTSVRKYQTMLDMACEDERVHGILQFYGGHTGRWAGRGLQPQNLTRNVMPDDDLDLAHDLVKAGDFEAVELLYGSLSDVFSQLVRTAFIPSAGNRFIVSDFSAIEARVIAWLSGEDWRLQAFRDGKDIYCESASQMFGVPVVKHGENGHLRAQGKVAELACGYGGGARAMEAMDFAHAIDPERYAGIVRQWRKASPKIVAMWAAFEDTAKAVAKAQKGGVTLLAYQNVRFYWDNGLWVRLPSGRSIAYPKAHIEDDQLVFWSQNQTTRKWQETKTYGGRLTENIVQSIARDLLADKMMVLEHEHHMPIVFHVHDELIIDASEGMSPDTVDEVMAADVDWAAGLPLKGGTYTCDFYRKD